MKDATGKRINKNTEWVNLDTGEILNTAAMLEQAAAEYDLDDYTNALEIWEYYATRDEIRAGIYELY